MAAVLACGPRAVLSHRSALELHGAAKPSRRLPAVTSRSHHKTPGIEVHTSTTLTRRDITVIDAVPCTSVARTLLDFAEMARPRELARAIEDLERIGLFDGTAMDRVLSRANGRRGTGRLRAALAEWTEPAFTRSEAERRALALIEAAALPRPNVNTFVAGHEVDLLWPEYRLAVEIDGYAFHSTRQAFERDAARDADLDDAGIRVMRITWRQLDREPEAVADRIRRWLRR